jgi:hypothetical protein
MGASNTTPVSPPSGDGGDGPVAVPAAGANIFGPTRAYVQSGNIIDFSTSQGIKLYHAAVADLKNM